MRLPLISRADLTPEQRPDVPEISSALGQERAEEAKEDERA